MQVFFFIIIIKSFPHKSATWKFKPGKYTHTNTKRVILLWMCCFNCFYTEPNNEDVQLKKECWLKKMGWLWIDVIKQWVGPLKKKKKKSIKQNSWCHLMGESSHVDADVARPRPLGDSAPCGTVALRCHHRDGRRIWIQQILWSLILTGVLSCGEEIKTIMGTMTGKPSQGTRSKSQPVREALLHSSPVWDVVSEICLVENENTGGCRVKAASEESHTDDMLGEGSW